MPSRDINSTAFHTYIDHLKEAHNIVRKYCIAKKFGLPDFIRHQKILEKNMVRPGSTTTPMLNDYPLDDIKKREKGNGKIKAT